MVPLEIWYRIFRIIDRASLKEISLVCKEFHSIATEILWEHVFVNPYRRHRITLFPIKLLNTFITLGETKVRHRLEAISSFVTRLGKLESRKATKSELRIRYITDEKLSSSDDDSSNESSNENSNENTNENLAESVAPYRRVCRWQAIKPSEYSNKLFKSLMSLRFVTRLEIRFGSVHTEEVESIIVAIDAIDSNMTELLHLSLKVCFKEQAPAWQTDKRELFCKSLKSLKLKVKGHNVGIHSFTQKLLTLSTSNKCDLENLAIALKFTLPDDMPDSDDEWEEFHFKQINPNLLYLSNLQTLELQYCSINTAEHITLFCVLKSLTLSSCFIEGSLHETLGLMPSLKNLVLITCLSQFSIEASLFFDLPLRKLHVVNHPEYNTVYRNENDVIHICTESFEELLLSNKTCTIRDILFSTSTIETLDLTDLSSSSIERLGILASHWPNSQCRKDFPMFVRPISKFAHLKHLNLAGMWCYFEDVIETVLMLSESLEELMLTDLQVKDKSNDKILNSLAKMKRIRRLRIDNCIQFLSATSFVGISKIPSLVLFQYGIFMYGADIAGVDEIFKSCVRHQGQVFLKALQPLFAHQAIEQIGYTVPYCRTCQEEHDHMSKNFEYINNECNFRLELPFLRYVKVTPCKKFDKYIGFNI